MEKNQKPVGRRNGKDCMRKIGNGREELVSGMVRGRRKSSWGRELSYSLFFRSVEESELNR